MPTGFDSSAVLFAESLNYMLCKQLFCSFCPSQCCVDMASTELHGRIRMTWTCTEHEPCLPGAVPDEDEDEDEDEGLLSSLF